MENMRFLYWDEYDNEELNKKPTNTFSDSLEDDE